MYLRHEAGLDVQVEPDDIVQQIFSQKLALPRAPQILLQKAVVAILHHGEAGHEAGEHFRLACLELGPFAPHAVDSLLFCDQRSTAVAVLDEHDLGDVEECVERGNVAGGAGEATPDVADANAFAGM